MQGASMNREIALILSSSSNLSLNIYSKKNTIGSILTHFLRSVVQFLTSGARRV